MTRLCLITGDQLSPELSALRAIRPGRDHVLMAELACEAGYVPHHVKKIALIFAAMRHFAGELATAGHRVFYQQYAPDAELRSFGDAITAHVRRYPVDELVVTWPGEWRVLEHLRATAKRLELPLRLLDDDRFVATPAQFAAWAEGRKTLRMEFFYREMRRRTGLLMEDGRPVGGRWNFDADNRRKWSGEPPPAHPMKASTFRSPAARRGARWRILSSTRCRGSAIFRMRFPIRRIIFSTAACRRA